jgi:hypothetical protein
MLVEFLSGSTLAEEFNSISSAKLSLLAVRRMLVFRSDLCGQSEVKSAVQKTWMQCSARFSTWAALR